MNMGLISLTVEMGKWVIRLNSMLLLVKCNNGYELMNEHTYIMLAVYRLHITPPQHLNQRFISEKEDEKFSRILWARTLSGARSCFSRTSSWDASRHCRDLADLVIRQLCSLVL